MSPRNNNDLMTAMLSRASTISFDPMVQSQRAQFNPSTGSWVFGLAAFAAGVALKKMIQPADTASPTQANDRSSSNALMSDGRSNNNMKALLLDTVAEERRSGDFLSSISSEVAKLREEVASLSAQKEQMRSHSVEGSYDRRIDEYSQVRETLGQLNAEKAKLARTEAELQQVLMEQKAPASGVNEAIYGDLQKVQHDLQNLKQDQERIQGEYEFSQKRAEDARSAMGSLKQMLDEKVAKLKEAEFREESLMHEHEILLETVANLKKQLTFFREQAKQDQSGVTSLKILEESNSRLSAQVDSSLYEAEQQQVALQRLVAEKSELAEKLDEYSKQARESEKRMQGLETALEEAKVAERALLIEVEELSKQRLEDDGLREERIKLENELAEARVSISVLEANENALNTKSGLVEVTAKEEGLNHEIENLLAQIKKLENERDLHKSRSEMSELKISSNGNEFDALKQSIIILESEKNALSTELQAYQREASEATSRQKEAEHLIRDSENKERAYREEIEAIRSQLETLESSKVEFSQQNIKLQETEIEIQQLLANRQSNEQELEKVRAELNDVKRELETLNELKGKVANEELLSSGRVAQIEAKLRERDHLIADARVKEDNLKSEVAVLQQTTEQLHGELERLREIQSGLGSSHASLNVLQETEKQLRDQLQFAQSQIEQQHQNLITAEQEKAQLEASFREESTRFANLQNENNFLKQQLAGWEAKEADQSAKLHLLDAGSQNVKLLEQELEQLRGQQLGMKSHLDSSMNEKGQLEQNLNILNGKLEHVVSERDRLSTDLEDVSVTLGSITAERDDLQNTCSKLQESIQDLVAQQKAKDTEHKQALLAMEIHSIPDEVVVKELAAEEDGVVKLELPKAKDDLGEFKRIEKLSDGRNEVIAEPSQAAYVTDDLDTSVFEPSSMEVKHFESPISENLFESSKVGRLRKFKGHRKTEDTEAKEIDLEERIQAYKERLEKGETEEEIALSMANADVKIVEEEDTKQKIYSPNRTFTDLLEDSERRKVEKTAVDLETTWTEVEDLEDEDIVLEEGTSYKPILWGGAAAGIGIATVVAMLYSQSNSSDPNQGRPLVKDEQKDVGSGEKPPLPGLDERRDSHIDEIDLSSAELKKEALDVLKKFHDSPDQNVKASLCRVPKRTLVDMKDYYSNRAQDYAVTDVEIDPQITFEGKMKFIKAKVKTELDGEEGSKVAYFVKDESGELKLDWYNYVGYEVTSWKQYLNLGDVEPQDWHVSVDLNGDEHPDYPEDKFVALQVRSWSPDAIDTVSAYLSKDNPMYQQLMDVYNSGQKTFILRLRHLGDVTNSLFVDEVISLSEFYVRDIDADVNSSIDEISFGDSSY